MWMESFYREGTALGLSASQMRELVKMGAVTKIIDRLAGKGALGAGSSDGVADVVQLQRTVGHGLGISATF